MIRLHEIYRKKYTQIIDCEDLSHASLLRHTRHYHLVRRELTHLVGRAIAGRIVI